MEQEGQVGKERAPRIFGVLLPSEVIVGAALLGTVLAYLVIGVSFRNPVRFYLMQLRAVAMLYPFGLFLALLVLLVTDGYRAKRAGEKPSEADTWRRFRKRYLEPWAVLRDLRLLNVALLTFVVFGHLKHLIPVINSALWDEQFLRFEQWLFDGLVAFEVFDQFVPRRFAGFLSHGYESYYTYFVVVLLVFTLQRRSECLADAFFCAFTLLWVFGVLMTYILPSWGPCFFVPELYADIPHTAMQGKQAELWAMKLDLKRDPDAPGAIFAISGLPSMHLAVVMLGTVFLHRLSKPLAACSWLVVLITIVSTLYFGWHYVLDDLASAFLVLLVVALVHYGYRAIPKGPSV